MLLMTNNILESQFNNNVNQKQDDKYKINYIPKLSKFDFSKLYFLKKLILFSYNFSKNLNCLHKIWKDEHCQKWNETISKILIFNILSIAHQIDNVNKCNKHIHSCKLIILVPFVLNYSLDAFALKQKVLGFLNCYMEFQGV